MSNTDCLFCKIVAGEVPCHKVWENKNHLAFLSIFPNTEGVTVVIPKEHYSSYVFDLPDGVYTGLLAAAKSVGKILDATFEDVGRTGMVFEGFGIDHVHAKLYPLHGTNIPDWKPLESQTKKEERTYFDTYPGYIASWDAGLVKDKTLAVLAEKIQTTAKKLLQNK